MRRRLAALAVGALALGAAGCGGGGAGSAAATGRVTVLAAASLTGPLTQAAGQLRASGLEVATSFAGSQALVAQLEAGAPADVVALADQPTMDRLVDAGLVEQPRTFATNGLAIAVAPGNPKRVAGLADLARPDVTVVLAAPQVPVGRYAREALAKAGATATSRSDEQDVKAALAKVTTGEADATIVYATDVRASGGRAEAVALPPEHDVRASYPIAVVRATADRAAAQRFVEEATAGVVQAALRSAGFGPPPAG